MSRYFYVVDGRTSYPITYATFFGKEEANYGGGGYLVRVEPGDYVSVGALGYQTFSFWVPDQFGWIWVKLYPPPPKPPPRKRSPWCW